MNVLRICELTYIQHKFETKKHMHHSVVPSITLEHYILTPLDSANVVYPQITHITPFLLFVDFYY